MLNEPKILILDETTAGLDPKERIRFRSLLEGMGQSSIVILSTHIISDVDKTADHVLLMKKGRMIYQGRREEIEEELEKFYISNVRKLPGGRVKKSL